MGEIGNLGDLSFVVKQVKDGIKMLSFTDLKRQSEMRVSEHESKRMMLEIDGPGLDELTLTIIAKAEFKTKPKAVANKLHKYRKNGTRLPFVLGGKKVGYGFYAITGISQTYEEINVNGQVAEMDFDVTLKQYPKAKKKQNANKKNSDKNSTKSSNKNSPEDKKTTSASGYQLYTVKKGDTLSAIALKYYGKASLFMKIFNANKTIIKNPSKIYVGQRLKIPK